MMLRNDNWSTLRMISKQHKAVMLDLQSDCNICIQGSSIFVDENKWKLHVHFLEVSAVVACADNNMYLVGQTHEAVHQKFEVLLEEVQFVRLKINACFHSLLHLFVDIQETFCSFIMVVILQATLSI